MSTTKKTTKTTSKKKNKPKKKMQTKFIVLLVASVLALIAGIFCFCIFYVVLGDYEGLGSEAAIPENVYSNKKFSTVDGRAYYEDKNYTSVMGIDVSEFQGDIDWEKVAADGVEFVMIRLGYSGMDTGKIYADSKYRENIAGARAAGLDVGVYFFSQAITTEEAVQEAKYVIRHIRGRGVTYPIAYDMEFLEGDRISDLTDLQRTEIADAFCSIIQKNGYQPIIYGNPTWLNGAINRSYLTNYDVWLAHYTKKTGYEGSFIMWQYTDSGEIDGISGNVDLDIYMKKN